MRGRSFPSPRLHAVKLTDEDDNACVQLLDDGTGTTNLQGDMDLRICVAYNAYNVNPGGSPIGGGVSKYSEFGGPFAVNRQYAGCTLAPTGHLRMRWAFDPAIQVDADSTERMPRSNGRLINIRSIMRKDATNEVEHLLKPYSPSRILEQLNSDVGWSRLGAVITGLPTNNATSSNEPVSPGRSTFGHGNTKALRMVAASIRDGIGEGGNVVAEFNASRLRIGETVYIDRFGNQWDFVVGVAGYPPVVAA